MSDTDQRPKVTVEDLLRLKRAERPEAAFWTSFERELRQKQLSALLQKRPWWQELPQLFARRAYLPVGATAILAFTLVSVKYYNGSAELAQAESTTHSATAPQAKASLASSEPASSPLVNRSEAAAAETNGQAAETVAQTAVAPAADESAELMPLLVPAEKERPSSRLLASNPVRLEQLDSDLTGAALSNRLSTPARVQVASLPQAELASVSTSASRRSRILAQYADRPLNPEPTPPAIVRERLARQLGGDADSGLERLPRRGNSDAFARPMPQIVALRF